MLILSSGEQYTPAHASREMSPDDEDTPVEDQREHAPADPDTSDEVAGDVVSSTDNASGGAVLPEHVDARPEKTEHTPLSSDVRGAHERAQPYAPGMRAHAYPPISPHTRGPAPERSGTVARPAGGFREEPTVEHEAAHPEAEKERGDSRERPAPQSRFPRAEHDDRSDHPPLRPETRGEVGPLIDALHGVFEQDRVIASQGGTTRCGICYLHFSLADLEYREVEGYYVCRACARSLGAVRLPMVRRQQRG